MPKMKTKKALTKRVRLTRTGKVMRNRTGRGHLKSVKSPSRIRRLRKKTTLSKGFAKIARKLLGK